jgi:hypothetical protein
MQAYSLYSLIKDGLHFTQQNAIWVVQPHHNLALAQVVEPFRGFYT